MFFKKRPSQNGGRARVSRPVQRNAVFSYASNRSVRQGAVSRSAADQQQDALRRGPRFAWLKRLPAVASLLVVIVIVLASLQLSSNARVITVGASESQIFLRDRKAYEEAIRESFSSLLNSNKLTVDTVAIAANLRKQFPELAEVSVSLPILGNRPAVYIQPAAPKLILLSAEGMYLLDRNGRALMGANQAVGLEGLRIPVVNDQSGLSIEVGKIALPTDTVTFVEEVVGQLRAKGLNVTSLLLPAGTNELHVRVDGAGYFIKFNLHGKAREEVGTYLAVRDYLVANQKTPGEYVDVRVENKAYYR